MKLVLLLALIVASVFAVVLWQRNRRLQREAFIRDYVLPRGLFEKLQVRHPELTPKDFQLVAQALRQFFLAHLKSGRLFVSMPSQVVDDLWHEFILYTRNYDVFCRQAFGRFMHHTPAAVLQGGQRRSNVGLRRCYWQACQEERIDPHQASRLPLLFAIDAKLAIAGGFHYAVDCASLRRPPADGAAPGDGAMATPIYCGGDFGNAGIDGSTEGFGPGGHHHGSDGGGGGDGSGGGADGGSGDGGSGGDGGSSGSGCGGGGCGGGS